MLITTSRLVLACTLLLLGTLTFAQSVSRDAVLFIWNDTIMAQTLNGNELVQASDISPQPQSIPTNGVNVYSIQQSPLPEPPADNYGFYQGLWSADGGQFVFMAIELDGAGYRLIALENGQQTILLSSGVEAMRGYLVPVGWANDGQLLLLERYMLHNLREVRLWQFNPDNLELTLLQTLSIPHLRGNSASLNNGWVFIGFDTVGVQGYLLNINTYQLVTFPTSFALIDPPASVFEVYPVAVLGVVDMAEFKSWLEQSTTDAVAENIPQDITSYPPFLHWVLPDYARSITCYPDSEWTDRNFATECPGLAEPRSYQGHEGTDMGGRPNGLPVGTPVYAAARGIVIDTYSDCSSDDITCGDAYGNYLLMEHTLVRNYNAETWFTGYAHLQTVLVEPYTYVEHIGIPIALSGDTGLGGAHLHFEIRAPHLPLATNWINPWDDTSIFGTDGLWIGGTQPVAAVIAFPPPTQQICRTIAGNNIRSGPGIAFDIVATTTIDTNYEVFQVQTVQIDAAPGDWYHIRWQGTDTTGWIWSGVMSDCTEP